MSSNCNVLPDVSPKINPKRELFKFNDKDKIGMLG